MKGNGEKTYNYLTAILTLNVQSLQMSSLLKLYCTLIDNSSDGMFLPTRKDLDVYTLHNYS